MSARRVWPEDDRDRGLEDLEIEAGDVTDLEPVFEIYRRFAPRSLHADRGVPLADSTEAPSPTHSPRHRSRRPR